MYRFLYTEQNNEKATDFETKALLYLLSMRDDSNEIELFIIDCFNDVTGADTNINKLWDLQSKGVKSLNPKKIGISLVTLFENYLSPLSFNSFIFFFPKLNEIYFKDISAEVFGIDNFHEKYMKKILQGLKEEYLRRNPKSEIMNIDSEISTFLDNVSFVIASENKSDYIKSIIGGKKSFDKKNKFFDSIFDEIRNKQSALKNTSIHRKQIEHPRDVLDFNKHLTKKEIEMLVVNRIIGIEIFKFAIPISFNNIIRSYSEDAIRDVIQESNAELSLLLFNNNNKNSFWTFFELVYNFSKENISMTVEEIYNSICEEKTVINIRIKEMSIKYFISLVKEGVMNENS
jgi:hypothetical protein